MLALLVPYRDALSSCRARVEQARERVATLEGRVTEALLADLPKRRARRLEEARTVAQALGGRTDLEGTQALDRALRRYGRLLARAIASAPKLAREINRLPRRYPERSRCGRGHWFPDVYDPSQQCLRQSIHDAITRADARAELLDARPGYFDDVDYPFLVEAQMWMRKIPLRLEVLVRSIPNQTNSGGAVRTTLRARYRLMSRVRPSTPALEVRPSSASARLLTWVGLQRDTRVGAKRFDEAFVVDGKPLEAGRLLREPMRHALMVLGAAVRSVELVTGDTVARLSWEERSTLPIHHGKPVGAFECAALEPAITVLALARATAPMSLLREA